MALYHLSSIVSSNVCGSGIMVAPAIGAALIGGATSLIGGIIGNKQRKRDAYNNSPAGIRRNAEAAGFNPLPFIGPSVNGNAGYAPVMGNAIANAGSAIAGTVIEKEQLDIQRSALEMDREKLDMDIQRQALTPRVSGIYGPTVGRPTGGGYGQNVNQADNALYDDFDPRNPDHIRVGGVDVERSNEWSDAETIEQRYGDVASWGYGLGVIAGDTWSNIRGSEYFPKITGAMTGARNGIAETLREMTAQGEARRVAEYRATQARAEYEAREARILLDNPYYQDGYTN